jgi:hypothetical protein
MHVTEADDRDRPADTDVDIIDVEFVATDLSMAGLLRLDLRRPAGATRFLASILRRGSEPVTVFDYDLPLATGAFEFRSSGVWVEFCCEEPLDHWTIGLEAFGLALPETHVVTPQSYGDRVPIGLDLDLDTTAAPEGDGRAFSIDVAVHGEVLIADQSYEIDAVGTRRRESTGVRPPHLLGVRHLSQPLGELTVAWPAEDGMPNVERRGWFGGARPGWTALGYSPE